MKKILVPVDGSENSMAALKKAKDLAILNDAEITILTIVRDLENHLYVLEIKDKLEIKEMLDRQGEEILKKGLKIFEGHEERVKSIFKKGDPAQEIIKISKEGDYDLIVMGSRGLNAFSRVMIGSVSNRVLNHVETSVLIVK